MLGLLNTVLSKGNTLLTYVKDGLVMANRFLTPPKLTFPVDASAEFNGTSDYVKSDSLPLSDWTNFTYSAWTYTETNAANQIVLSFGNSSNTTPISLLESRTDNTYRVYHRDDAAADVVADSNALTLNEWYYITATKEGNTIKIFVDGSEHGSQTDSTGSVTLNTFNVGRLERTTASNYFDGNLANVAIWNRALSSDEINSVMWKGYNALATTEKSGLQAWYKLDESELFDASNTSTTNLEEYAKLNSVTFEGKACLQTALNALPDITDARLYSGRYDALE